MALSETLHASPASFFQFDRERNDARVLRTRIEGLRECFGHFGTVVTSPKFLGRTVPRLPDSALPHL